MNNSINSPNSGKVGMKLCKIYIVKQIFLSVRIYLYIWKICIHWIDISCEIYDRLIDKIYCFFSKKIWNDLENIWMLILLWNVIMNSVWKVEIIIVIYKHCVSRRFLISVKSTISAVSLFNLVIHRSSILI